MKIKTGVMPGAEVAAVKAETARALAVARAEFDAMTPEQQQQARERAHRFMRKCESSIVTPGERKGS
jgi:hypothetical protein